MSTTMERIGDWMQVASGGRFWPFDARSEEIHIEDIAAATAKLCRFGGHCNEFYSVAEHSVRVSYACAPDDALWGLLHDASEAYLGDIPRPIKRQPAMRFYHEAEAELMRRIALRFGLDWRECGEGWWIPDSVHRADEILLATEARDLMGNHCLERWSSLVDIEPLRDIINPWSPSFARLRFLERFAELAP